MLWGNVQTVAIELTPVNSGFCGIRLWLNGVPIGKPDLYGTAGALADTLERCCSRAAERIQPALWKLAAQPCLDVIYDALFGERDDLATSVTLGQAYGACLLSPNACECLDDFLFVIIGNGAQQRLIARSFATGTVTEAWVADGSFERICEPAIATLRTFDLQRC